MPTKSHSWGRILIYSLLALVLLVLAARFTIFLSFEISSSAMADTLEPGEVVLVNKWDNSIERGDIVVFQPSLLNYLDIKRVIGLPYEQLVLRDGWVYLRTDAGETKLDEPYLNAENMGHTYPDPPMNENPTEVIFTIPFGHYFVMGDNRLMSMDSRSFQGSGGVKKSFIERWQIVGTVWFH